MSSARIPLLSGDLPFFEFVDCGLQLFCRNLWDSCRLFGIVVVHVSAAVVFIFTWFLFWFIILFVFVEFFVEFTKDIGNSFPRCDAFPFLVSCLCEEYSLLCLFDSRDISYSFEVFKNSLDIHLPFHSFLSLIHFLCTCSLLSVVVSLLWVYFSSPRWVSGFQHLWSTNLRSLLLLQMQSRALHYCHFWFRSCCCWNGTR